jgi:MoaA/NifB/PqqE/SkfB family radical SAM enzyme
MKLKLLQRLKDSILGVVSAVFKLDKALNRALVVQVEVTTYSNIKSIRQGINGGEVKQAHMPQAVFRNAMNKLQPHKVIFSGFGEPFLDPDIFDFIGYCSAAGIHSTLVSTMSTNVRDSVSAIGAGLSMLRISLDAAKADTYRKINGDTASFEFVVSNITELIKQQGGKTENIQLEYVIMKENIEEIPDFIEFANTMKIKTIDFRELKTEGMTEERRKALLEGFDFPLLKRQMKKGIAVAKKFGIKTNLMQLFDNFNSLVDVYSRAASSSLGVSCVLPWINIFVDVNGNVSPCYSLSSGGGIRTGNVVSDSRSDLLNGISIKCIRKGFRKGNVSPVCRNCIPCGIRKMFGLSGS